MLLFQLFDACLAPDTMGDGTGCDNMTAVIVRFRKHKGANGSSSSQTTTTKGKTNEVAAAAAAGEAASSQKRSAEEAEVKHEDDANPSKRQKN